MPLAEGRRPRGGTLRRRRFALVIAAIPVKLTVVGARPPSMAAERCGRPSPEAPVARRAGAAAQGRRAPRRGPVSLWDGQFAHRRRGGPPKP